MESQESHFLITNPVFVIDQKDGTNGFRTPYGLAMYYTLTLIVRRNYRVLRTPRYFTSSGELAPHPCIHSRGSGEREVYVSSFSKWVRPAFGTTLRHDFSNQVRVISTSQLAARKILCDCPG